MTSEERSFLFYLLDALHSAPKDTVHRLLMQAPYNGRSEDYRDILDQLYADSLRDDFHEAMQKLRKKLR